MNKLAKISLIVISLLIFAVAGGGVYLSRNLPQIIKNSVESYGPKVTGTAVALGGINIIYGTGRVALKDLIIANPPGFKSPHAFSLTSLSFQVDPFSVFKKVIIINEFSVSNANIIAEQAGTGLQTNLQQILNNVERQGGKSKNQPAEKSGKNKSNTSVKLILENFVLTDNSIYLKSEMFGEKTIAMPDITFKDIGKKEGGLSPDQLTQRLIELLSKQASEAARDELERIAKEKAKDKFSTKLEEKWNSLFN